MDDSHKNFTPISISGALPKGSFLSSGNKKAVMGVVGALVMVVMVGVGAAALRNNQSITTPAQTVVGPICPEGSKQIAVDSTNVDGMSSMCPGGEIIIVEGTKASSTINSAAAGTSDGSGDGSTALPGTTVGDGDTSRTGGSIACCRPSTPSPTPTPPPSSDTPITPPVDTPEACILPTFQISNVSMTVVNCENCDE